MKQIHTRRFQISDFRSLSSFRLLSSYQEANDIARLQTITSGEGVCLQTITSAVAPHKTSHRLSPTRQRAFPSFANMFLRHGIILHVNQHVLPQTQNRKPNSEPQAKPKTASQTQNRKPKPKAAGQAKKNHKPHLGTAVRNCE